MIDTKVIVEALGDARDDLGKITLAAHMIEDKIPYDLKSVVNRIAGIDKDISTIQKNMFNDWMIVRVKKLNDTYKCGTRKSHIVLMADGRLTLCNKEALFIAKNYNKDDMDHFEQNLPEIIKRIQCMADIINENHQKVEQAIQYAIAELQKQPFITNKKGITVEKRPSNTSTGEGELIVNIKYMQFEQITFTIYMTRALNEQLMSQQMADRLIDYMQKYIVQNNMKSINNCVKEICDKNNLKVPNFRIFKKNTQKLWDFEEGYINYDLDLSNEKVYKVFTKDLVYAAKTVEFLYNSSYGNLCATKNICVGDYYYYQKKDSREYNGQIYDIFECRIGTKKPLNILISNGQRIYGRKATKILKEIGCGRKRE